MRSTCAARLRNALSASAAAGHLSGDLASLDPETLRFILSDWQLWARDDQLPPATDAAGDPWRVWLILGGRGAGKTRSGAEWVRAKALGAVGLLWAVAIGTVLTFMYMSLAFPPEVP